MRSFITVVAAVGLCGFQPAFAQDASITDSSEPTSIIRTSDIDMTCAQIGDEAARLSDTMGGAPGGGLFGVLGGVARAGAAMVIPGAGLVTAAADALTQGSRDRREARELSVEHRWYYLNGLYAGQRCHDRAEAAVAATSATPVRPAILPTPLTPVPRP